MDRDVCPNCGSTVTRKPGTDCFRCKLLDVQFSAGAKTYPKNYYDNQALEQLGFTEEGREEHMDIVEGMPLKWDRKTPYRKDKVGDYVKATDKDVQRMMYGSAKRAKKLWTSTM